LVEDASGCTSTQTADIINPELISIDSIVVNPIACYGECTASISSIQVSGGTPPYFYSVNGGLTHPNTSYFHSYCTDTYTVEVRDINSCYESGILIIDEPDELVVDITTSLWNNYQIRCNGDSSGVANVNILGGVSPYNIVCVNNITLDTLHNSDITTVNNLKAGTYSFYITDALGCDFTQSLTYFEPSLIQHNFIATHVSCSGWFNGSLLDSVYGGVGNATSYSYLWNTLETTYAINGIGIGEYIIEVTDENNCLSIDTFIINDNNAMSATSVVTSVSCFDICDGSIAINVTGGIPNINSNGDSIYSYLWNDTLFQTTQTAVGLCADNNSNSTSYTCEITDLQGCILQVTGTITQPTQIVVTTSIDSEIICYGETNGMLNSLVTGGLAPYQYMWSNNSPNYSPASDNNNVSAGDYVITVKDAEGCFGSDFITLTEPTQITLTISDTAVSCYGFDDGKIIATAENGTPFLGIPPKYLYTVLTNLGVVVDANTIDIGVFEGLTPGIYIVEVEDRNGCAVESGTIYISQPGDSLSISFNTIDASCLQANGQALVVVNGGTPFTTGSSYQYTWENGISTANNINLSAGYYPITVIDSRDCEISDSAFVKGTHNVFADSLSEINFNICLGDSVLITINETPLNTYIWENGSTFTDRWVYPDDYVNVYTLSITDLACGESYDVFATVNVDFIDAMPASNPGVEHGNFPVVLSGESIEIYSDNNNCQNYTWTWTLDTINEKSTVISPENTSWYYINVEDSEGCLGYDSIYVVVGVKPYEAITPNNDGFNDTWTPLDIESYEKSLVQVFNRWGGLVFESTGGTSYQPWDGTNEGAELPVGTYYYIIDLNTGDEPQTGPITIIR
jgi:gliding motility-associated-like protein